MLPIVPAYLIGVVTAPLVVAIAKPVVRGTVKASVGIGLQVRRAAAEAREDYQTLATEARTEVRKEGRAQAKA